MNYRIIVHKSKDNKEVIKLYNTKEKVDAEKIYNHWILEANNKECVEMYHNDKLIKHHVKIGKAKMEVLK